MTEVYIKNTSGGLDNAVEDIFKGITESNGLILKESKKVYIKVNGVHCKPHCYTSPNVLQATINYLYNNGAKVVYVMEDSTIGNVTRLVFDLVGYKEVCKSTGAVPIYLDEEKADNVQIKKNMTLQMPRTIVHIVKHRDDITYINLPKLKTHNATVVTLGLKNQFGFVSHAERAIYHDANLHSTIADLYEYIKPDITIIDAIDGISGEIPLASFESNSVTKYDLLIGGIDGLAVDVVGAKLLGYEIEEVPHLKIAAERGLGEGRIDNMHCVGESIDKHVKKIGWDIVDKFPEDVLVVRGNKKLCREGCEVNTLLAIQMMIYDYGGKGGFFAVMGEGFPPDTAEKLRRSGYKRGLVAGSCAVREVGEKLMNEFGKKNVFLSNDCCNVAETVSALVELTGITTFDLLPTTVLKSLGLFVSAKLNGSRAIMAKLF